MRYLFIAASITALAANAHAAPLMPSFADVPTGWTTDRYEANEFVGVGSYQGRDNVLKIGISTAQGSANRSAGTSGDFYNTQGRQHAAAGGAGSSLAADLYIDAAWRDGANGNVRTDMWGITDNQPLVYPIIGFTNFGGNARYRLWDADTANGWVDLATAVAFDAWTSFEILFTGTAFEYFINGASVYTDTTIGGTTGFSAVIMQAYNFNDSNFDNNTATGFVGGDYAVHWANANAVPEPGSLALAGLALAGLAAARRRRA